MTRTRSTSSTDQQRYSLRKRSSAPSHGNDNGDVVDVDSDTELELLLQQHEEDGIRDREEKRKKARFHWFSADGRYDNEPPPDPVPLDHLPSPCIERIFEFLPSPSDVYNLAFTSKFVLSHVNAEIVVRSAVHENAGNYNKQTSKRIVGNLVKQVKAKSIHVPSPLRILRLLNAKRCERGDLCWAYNLEERKSFQLNSNSSCQRPFGLALCSRCVKGCTISVPRWYAHFAREEDRVATTSWSQVFQPNAAAELGGKVGPIIHARHIFQIQHTHGGNRDNQKDALQRLIVELYGEEDSEQRAKYDAEVAELVEIHERAEADLEAFVEAKDKREREERKAKWEVSIAKRVERTRPVFEKLQRLLEGAPQVELALECTWNEDSHDCLEFKHAFVASAMKRILDAPASATNKALVKVATLIRTNLETLAESGDFFTFSFLVGSTSTLKQTLRSYCVENFTSPNVVLQELRADGQFFELLRKKNYMTAMLRVLRSDSERIPHIVSLAFVPDGHENVVKHRSLAKAAWEKFQETRLPGGNAVYPNPRDAVNAVDWTPSQFRQAVSACRTEWRRLKQNARDYLARRDTVAFLNGNVLGENFTRQDAIDEVYRPKRHAVRRWGSEWGVPHNIAHRVPYQLLLDREFDLLLQVHRYYYRRGRA